MIRHKENIKNRIRKVGTRDLSEQFLQLKSPVIGWHCLTPARKSKPFNHERAFSKRKKSVSGVESSFNITLAFDWALGVNARPKGVTKVIQFKEFASFMNIIKSS